MFMMKWLAGGTVAVAMMVSPVLAFMAEPPANANTKAAKPEKAPAKPAVGGWATLIKETKASDEQIAKIAAAVAESRKKQADWAASADGQALKAAEEELVKAREAKDEARIKAANDKLKELRAKAPNVKDEEQKAVRAALSPEQLQAWEGYNMCNGMLGRFRKAEMKEDQKAKCRELCNAAAKDVLALTGEPKVVDKAKGEIVAKVAKSIEETVLSAEQREALKKPDPPKQPKAPDAPKDAPKDG